ncbi:MAG: LysM peptidoglycan-binding domain-containing protein [Jatrophihabitantaceae bacterium]
MIKLSGRLTILLLATLDGYTLCRFRPAPASLSRELSAPHAWVAQVGADAAVSTAAGALLWVTAAWLAVALIATLIATLTGRQHGLLATISHRATPALLRRLVIASTGASIALTPITALAAGAGPGGAGPTAIPTGVSSSALTNPPARGQAGSTAAQLPPVGWPIDPVPAALSPPHWPRDQTSSMSDRDHSGLSPAATMPVRPPIEPTTQPPATGRTPALPLDPEPAQPAGSVLVRPGDSLWLITAQRLGPAASESQIAVGWPYWYRKNRPVIGRDPNLLRPGELLSAPAVDGGS